MSDPQKADVPNEDAPTRQLVIEATGLLRATDGIFVVVTLSDCDGGTYCVPLHPATAEALTSRLSALTKSAYWAQQGGETLEPIVDLT